MEAEKRDGHFTSSQMHRLCTSLKNGNPSKAFDTYIDEVTYEIAMGRSCDVEINTKPLKWGSLMEVVLFNLLGLSYSMTHKSTIEHPTLKYFSGTPDLIVEGQKVGEIKSYYPKNFCALSLCIAKKNVQLFKEDFPKEYWQIVANSILCKVKRGEILIYMPYETELKEIIEEVEKSNLLEMNDLNPSDYYFLTHDDFESLPFLPDNSKISNLNTFEFEIPKEDKEFLISRLKLATEKLEENLKLI